MEGNVITGINEDECTSKSELNAAAVKQMSS
jgi:hypothetical protein